MTDKEVAVLYLEVQRLRSMKSRCRLDPLYAGRGIKVCDEWKGGLKGFLEYYKHVSQLEHFGEEGYTLDRINVNGDYEPGNVRWADKKTQQMNRRCTIRDRNQTLDEIAEERNLPLRLIRERWYRGERGDELRAQPHSGIKTIKKRTDERKSSDAPLSK